MVCTRLAEAFPWSLHGRAQLSSVLWRDGNVARLSHMAVCALAEHYYSANTWIVVANALSADGEHDHAMRALRRAIEVRPFKYRCMSCLSLQLEPDNWYAYTLLGHENVITDAAVHGCSSC
jgi:hypothetical protein